MAIVWYLSCGLFYYLYHCSIVLKDMVLNSTLLPLLYSAIGTATKKQITSSNIEFIVSENIADDVDDLDDLIQ